MQLWTLMKMWQHASIKYAEVKNIRIISYINDLFVIKENIT